MPRRVGGSYSDRDLSVFVAEFTGKRLAHGANHQPIGRGLLPLKEVDGKAFVVAMIDPAKTGKAGWWT